VLDRRIPKYLLNLAGEYRVASELNKQGVFATVTYGNRKSADVYATGTNGVARKVEVKTSQTGTFVTRISQKGLFGRSLAPDFWVLVYFLPNESERFFILSHEEICIVQKKRNDEYARNYEEIHERWPDISKGVDNVRVKDVQAYEGRWTKIIDAIGGPERDLARKRGRRVSAPFSE
jgi:hypothetical protein